MQVLCRFKPPQHLLMSPILVAVFPLMLLQNCHSNSPLTAILHGGLNLFLLLLVMICLNTLMVHYHVPLQPEPPNLAPLPLPHPLQSPNPACLHRMRQDRLLFHSIIASTSEKVASLLGQVHYFLCKLCAKLFDYHLHNTFFASRNQISSTYTSVKTTSVPC